MTHLHNNHNRLLLAKSHCQDKSSQRCKAKVRFAEEPIVVNYHSSLPVEENKDLWFSTEYLKGVRKEEIKNNLRAQYLTRTSVEDSETMTWRGLEDILEKYCRREKVHNHVRAVMRLQPKCSPHALSRHAKAFSKADRHRALRLAKFDELVAGSGGTSTMALSKNHHHYKSPNECHPSWSFFPSSWSAPTHLSSWWSDTGLSKIAATRDNQ